MRKERKVINDLQIVVTKDLPAVIADKIKIFIVNNGFLPGEKFYSENELMKKFEVGRSTIREAIKILIAENVVEIKKGVGTYISENTGIGKDPLGMLFLDQSKLLYNLFETRLIIEPRIAALASMRATDEEIKTLVNIAEEFDLENGSEENFVAMDIEYHTAIAKMTQNDILYRFLPIICDSIQEGSVKTQFNLESQKRAVESHLKIVDAIQKRDADLATKEVEKHILFTAQDAQIKLGEKE